jgi:hypothetical protein
MDLVFAILRLKDLWCLMQVVCVWEMQWKSKGDVRSQDSSGTYHCDLVDRRLNVL